MYSGSVYISALEIQFKFAIVIVKCYIIYYYVPGSEAIKIIY